MANKSKIMSLRLEAKMSQNQLARKADLDRGTISSAENGNNVQDVTRSKIASALSEALGRAVDMEDLN